MLHSFKKKAGILLASALCLTAGHALAFPTKTVTIIVPTAAGGGNDAMARMIAQKMAPTLGQSVIVDNKPGANGSIAVEFVSRANPDGHTILFGYVATHGMNPALQKLRYDPVNDFEAVGLVGYAPSLMVVNPSVKGKTPKEILATLKSQSGKLSYASAGNGTAPHFAAELFKMSTGIDMLHIPYKGSAPGVVDTIAGQTQVMFPSLFTGSPHVKSGKLVAVAIAGDKRTSVLPNVPTLKELGVQGVDVQQWYGIFAPAKTPKDVVQKLNAALNKALNDPEVMKSLEAQGTDVETSTPEQFKKLVIDDLAKWKRIVKEAKISAD